LVYWPGLLIVMHPQRDHVDMLNSRLRHAVDVLLLVNQAPVLIQPT
jgi:hypothetical protein